MLNPIKKIIFKKLKESLTLYNLNLSPQAQSAFVEMLYRCDPEYIGDTDTVLAGLLMSGSYTVDILEKSGVKIDLIKNLTLSTASGVHQWNPDHDESPLDMLLDRLTKIDYLHDISSNDNVIESGDLLKYAIAPELSDPWDQTVVEEIYSLKKGASSESHLTIELEKSVIQTLIIVTDAYLSKKVNWFEILSRRKKPITEEEDWILDKNLGVHYRGMTIDELEWLISALNSWFVNRIIQITPATLCLNVVSRISQLLFAPDHFSNSGGDLNRVEVGLDVAKKFVPDREDPIIALFLRENRIFAGQFTYRDFVQTYPGGSNSSDIYSNTKIYSPRPIPLINSLAIREFENILSNQNISEHVIQNFLTQNPEFLLSLGYTNARPHICLREDGCKKLIPDFILELPSGQGFDILDLKLPNVKLTVQNPYLRISYHLNKAVAQLKAYSNFFNNAKNRKNFEKTFGLQAFKPELIVVIGRRHQISTREESIEIKDQLGIVKLYTYDDLLAYAKTRVIEMPSEFQF